MPYLHQRYSYQGMVPSGSLSDSKTSFLDDYEAYEQYYSTDRLPFHLPFRCRRFQLLAIAVLVFLFTLFVRRHHSGVFDFGISLEAHTPTKTLGGVLRCDPEVMKPSAKTPDDVNQVRPADINVIAAMGDSITVAYLSRNYHDDPYLLYPGNSYVTGGDETLEKHISVATHGYDNRLNPFGSVATKS